MPEILIKIVMQIYGVSSADAEDMLWVELPGDSDDN